MLQLLAIIFVIVPLFIVGVFLLAKLIQGIALVVVFPFLWIKYGWSETLDIIN